MNSPSASGGYQTIPRIELGEFSGNFTPKNLADLAEGLRIAPVDLLETHTPWSLSMRT